MEYNTLKYCGLAFLNLQTMNSQYNSCQRRVDESTTMVEDCFDFQFHEPSLSAVQASHLTSAIKLYNMLRMQELLPHHASLSGCDERSESASLPCDAPTSRKLYPRVKHPVCSQSCHGRLESWCLDSAKQSATCSEQFALRFSFMPSSTKNQQPSIHCDSPSVDAIVGLEILLDPSSSDGYFGSDDCDSLSTTTSTDEVDEVS